MRTLILSIWISVILLPFSGCTHDDKELLAFYLSQPRDSKLIGKWQFLADPSMFQIYNEDGYSRFTLSKELPVQYYKIEGDYLYINDNNFFRLTPTYKRVKK